ncbi:MAG: glycosyltransferase family 9 protein [Candidatus Tyrphobacter sp.]
MSDVAKGCALVACAGGGFGDSLLASVVARALHERYARVDALTLPGHRAALQRVPDVDAVLVDDGGDEASLAAKLCDSGYDAAVVTWATARIARVLHRAKIPVRVGQARRLYSRLFTKRVVVRSETGDVTSHWTQVLLDYARALDCDAADAIPRFVPTPEDESEAQSVAHEHGFQRGGFLILHPANAIASTRAWPVRGWRALALALGARFSMPVAVTGGRADAELVRKICDGGAIPLAGRVGIGGFGALASRTAAYVGITTGTMHVAASVGAPTLGIFPFQSDFPERWAPLGRKTVVVRASYRCHDGDTKERCRDYACIEHLDVPGIVDALASLLR